MQRSFCSKAKAAVTMIIDNENSNANSVFQWEYWISLLLLQESFFCFLKSVGIRFSPLPWQGEVSARIIASSSSSRHLSHDCETGNGIVGGEAAGTFRMSESSTALLRDATSELMNVGAVQLIKEKDAKENSEEGLNFKSKTWSTGWATNHPSSAWCFFRKRKKRAIFYTPTSRAPSNLMLPGAIMTIRGP